VKAIRRTPCGGTGASVEMTYGLIYRASPKLKTVEITAGLLYILPKMGDLIKISRKT